MFSLLNNGGIKNQLDSSETQPCPIYKLSVGISYLHPTHVALTRIVLPKVVSPSNTGSRSSSLLEATENQLAVSYSFMHLWEPDKNCILQILEDKPDLSRWSLKYKAFGRDIEFSWLARNMQVRMTRTTFFSLQLLKHTFFYYLRFILRGSN